MLNILPRLAGEHFVDAHLRDAVLRGDGTLRETLNRPYLWNHCLAEFGLNATALIDRPSYRLKMVWVHAARKATEMIQFQFVWNWAVGAFIVNPRSRALLTVLEHATIPEVGSSALPHPTPCLISVILNQIIDAGNACMVSLEKLSGLAFYKPDAESIESDYRGSVVATAVAKAKGYFHSPLPVGWQQRPGGPCCLTMRSMRSVLADLSQQLEYSQ